MHYNFFELPFISYAASVTVYILLVLLLTELIHRCFSKSRRGFAVYFIPISLFLFMLPVHTELLPGIIRINAFDMLLWSYSQANTDFVDLGLIQGYGTTDPEVSDLTLSEMLFAVWLTGFIVSVVIEIVRYCRLRHDISLYSIKCIDERILSCISENSKGKAPSVLIYSRASTPFVTGLFRPVILLPHTAWSDEELRLILRHELTHIRRRDILVKIIFVAFRCLNWYDPLIYILCRRAFEDMEFSVDESVTRGSDSEEKLSYSQMIIHTAAGKSCSDCTTCLSLSGKVLKKRVDAIMLDKRTSLIPTVLALTAMLTAYLLIIPVSYPPRWANSKIPVNFVSIPIEKDPIITDESLRSVMAESFEDAGYTYLETLLENYMREDIPEYYRITDYHIERTSGVDNTAQYSTTTGSLNDTDVHIVRYRYIYRTYNECGNTVHNKQLPLPTFNGLNRNDIVSFVVRLIGPSDKEGFYTYHIDEIGSDNLSSVHTSFYHFENFIPSIEQYYSHLAYGGFLDRDNSDSEALAHDVTEYLKTNNITSESESLGLFEYCGYDYDLKTTQATIYGNVYTAPPHGVKIQIYPPCSSFHITGNLVTITCTDLYPSIEYHDSFDVIDFQGISDTPNAENAKARLDHMSTPRDGTDFTVLEYRNIREENGSYYADVRFKGRLEGVYSVMSFINDHGGEDNWYLEHVKII